MVKVHESSSIAGSVWDNRIITERTLDTEDSFDPVKKTVIMRCREELPANVLLLNLYEALIHSAVAPDAFKNARYVNQ